MNDTAAGGWFFDPILPIPVIAILAVFLLVVTVRIYWQVGRSIGTGRNLFLLAFRILGLALVILLLLQPSQRITLPPVTKDRVLLVGLDTSLSMKQRDAGKESRFDTARNLLEQSGVVAGNGTAANARTRLFGFAEDARFLPESILNLVPTGRTTFFDKSIATMLATPAGGETIDAIVLLTDGHDFQMVNPVKTGLAAHNLGVPIYAAVLGQQGSVRDVAVHITGFQPYCYVKQKAHINAVLRLIGCELEDLDVRLLRQGQVIQTKRVNAQQLQELPVEFEIVEPEVGQYEYEVQVQPLATEADTTNNSAITYLNVIDRQARVLLLEGDPSWDTTFLQRSLMRDDKIDVDALIRYGANRVRALRKTAGQGELKLPRTVDEFAAYDVVILGRAVDTLPDSSWLSTGPNLHAVLDQYVKDRGGVVIFGRGPAFPNPSESGLEPVSWVDDPAFDVRLSPTPEGRSLSMFQVLNGSEGGMDALSDLIDGNPPHSIQPLTSVLATRSGRDDATPVPAMVHRRYGQGQVMSIGVDGLWRWAFNSKVQATDSPFDRFWDQTILWLLGTRDFIPTRQFSFRPNSANIMLGEKVYFHLTLRQPDPNLKAVPVTISYGDEKAGRTMLAPSAASASRLSAEFLPERAWRYRAVVNLPDGTTQESRFVVFSENLEETEVATDALYLRRLCEASGGRIIEAGELPKLIEEMNHQPVDQAPTVVTKPAWNQAWAFYLAGLLFGLDWFWRRRWGLC